MADVTVNQSPATHYVDVMSRDKSDFGKQPKSSRVQVRHRRAHILVYLVINAWDNDSDNAWLTS